MIETLRDGTEPLQPTEFARLAAGYDVVVLDVHGVVFNRPLHDFLGSLGGVTGETPVELRSRWRRDIRLPFWTGAIDERTMWRRLAPGADAAELRADLERRFAAGPLFGAVTDHDGPVWLLSNHRSSWLHDRLERFGLGDRFERVFVSDEIGAAKPSRAAFSVVAAAAGRGRVCFLDDQQHNVDTARSVGFDARRIDATHL